MYPVFIIIAFFVDWTVVDFMSKDNVFGRLLYLLVWCQVFASSLNHSNEIWKLIIHNKRLLHLVGEYAQLKVIYWIIFKDIALSMKSIIFMGFGICLVVIVELIHLQRDLGSNLEIKHQYLKYLISFIFQLICHNILLMHFYLKSRIFFSQGCRLPLCYWLFFHRNWGILQFSDGVLLNSLILLFLSIY